MQTCLLFALCALSFLLLLASRAEAQPADAPAPLAPFVLPWDDASGGVTNVASWSHKPAGKLGFVTVRDAHLFAGDERVRFLGVNLCFWANFPTHEQADKIAARMAKFGINCVRFHHMDTAPAPMGLLKADGMTLDPDRLDRLDYLIAQLKANGIYANLNLHVGRMYPGLPKTAAMANYFKGVDAFYPEMIRLQRDYARDLLTHVNPYTRTRYADEPAVAFVEINNEAGLIQEWLSGTLDDLPEIYAAELRKQWNAWLAGQHADLPALRKRWQIMDQPAGVEMLPNGRFSEGNRDWIIEQHQPAKATARKVDFDGPVEAAATAAMEVTVQQVSREGWHVQVCHPRLAVKADSPYSLTFWAWADQPIDLAVAVSQYHEPWQSLWQHDIAVGPKWRQFSFTFAPSDKDDNARLNIIGLGTRKATLRLAAVSLRPGGVVGLAPGETWGKIAPFHKADIASRTVAGQREWLRFLWEAERAYWQGMQRYLKDDLKVKSLIIGTIVGCSTPTLMADMDVIDTHAYWRHPRFPGRPWDQANWTVANESMVNTPGHELAALSAKRVAGKPFVVTEYNHPAPNTFAAEAPLMAAAVAAIQDWDGVFLFSYCHRDNDWAAGRIPNFFDIDQHPTKMSNMPVAAAMLRRADVTPCKDVRTVVCRPKDEIDLLRTVGASWRQVDADLLGLARQQCFASRLAIRLAPDDTAPPVVAPPQWWTAGQAETKCYPDTPGQLRWDLSKPKQGVLTVDSPRTKMVVGYVAGRSFRLGDVTIAPGATRQDWCTVSVSAMSGDAIGKPGRLLIVATGYAENADICWTDASKTSCGKNWGKGPSVVECVPATITLPAPAGKVQAWSLSPTGQRETRLPVRDAGANACTIALGGPVKTLWYEVEVQ